MRVQSVAIHCWVRGFEDNLPHREQISIRPFVHITGILIITSYAGHDELRSAHRQAMPTALLAGLGLRRVFLLAALPPTERYITQAALRAEHTRFGDLVQGNFREAYRNLTYKHTMGLRWASHTKPDDCHHRARFIVKADDDTVFDVYQLHANLQDLSDNADGLPQSAAFLAGFVLADKKPIRNVASKWYVSHDEYPGERYPDYLSGWLYLTNPATARRLVGRAQREPFMWIDDTWMTGIVRQPLGIGLMRLNHWFSANAEFLDCCIADLRRWGVRCDYSVGPNGGDGRLLGEFVRAVERCYVDDGGQMWDEGGGDGGGGVLGGCKERSPEQRLATSCVARRKDLVEEHGRPVVEAIKL